MSLRPPRKDNLRKSWPSPSRPKYFDVNGDGKIIITKYGFRGNIDHVNLMTLYRANYVFVTDNWNEYESNEEFWAEDNWPKTMTVVKDRSGDFGGSHPGLDMDKPQRTVVEMSRNDFMKLLLAS